MSELHRAVTRESHDGRWLDLLCGVRGVVGRFDELLARYVPGAPSGEPGDASAEVILVLLGLIAVRDRIHGALALPAAPRMAAEKPAARESLLR